MALRSFCLSLLCQNLEAITSNRGVVGGRDDGRFLGVLLPGGDFGESLRILASIRGRGSGFLVQREISEKMAVLIIKSLNPFKVIVE